MVNTALLAALLVSNVALLVFLALTAGRAWSAVRAFKLTVRSFLSPPDAKTPSPLASMLDETAQLVGRALVMQLKASFMGEASAASRQGRVAESAAVLAKFPWLATIAGIAPGFSKSLLKNPALLSSLAGLIDKGKGPGAAGPPPGSNGHESQVKFEV